MNQSKPKAEETAEPSEPIDEFRSGLIDFRFSKTAEYYKLSLKEK